MGDLSAEPVWEAFHHAVNMNSNELRQWLLADASGQEAFPAGPDLGVSGLGRHVVSILRKRKVDLTADDIHTMSAVVGYIEDRLSNPPAAGPADPDWRRSLMSVGHDPLKPGTP
jgi:hypothetical protein